jgi:hypothetical protein
MKRRERERAPFLTGWAAPASWWATAWVLGIVATVVAIGLGAPIWVILIGGPLAGGLADVYWRRTRPPSADAKWTALTRLFYRHVPPGHETRHTG